MEERANVWCVFYYSTKSVNTAAALCALPSHTYRVVFHHSVLWYIIIRLLLLLLLFILTQQNAFE